MKHRIVIDTNVYAASLPNKNLPPEMRQACLAAIANTPDNFVQVMTAATVRELENVYLRDRYDAVVPKSQRRDAIAALVKDADYIRLGDQPAPACADPNDVPFLAAAHQRQAKYLVTNDFKHLGSMGRIDETLIVSPAQFLLLENQGPKLGRPADAPTQVVATDHAGLLRQGHTGSTVFLSPVQAPLVKGHAIETVPLVPLYNPHNRDLKQSEPESYLMVTDNPDLLRLRTLPAAAERAVVVMAADQYALLKNTLSTNPPAFADSLRPTGPTATSTVAVRSYAAGRGQRPSG